MSVQRKNSALLFCAPLGAALLLLALGAAPALGDGTETLGAPSVTIASGSGIAIGGVGLADSQPGNLSVDVPLGATVEQVLLYWEGANQLSVDATPTQTIEVDGSAVTGAMIGGDTQYALLYRTVSYRADITAFGLIGPGSNTISVGGLDFTTENDGAGVLVIYDDGTSAVVEIRDGNDYAHIRNGGALMVTVPQTFSFAAAPFDRTARIDLLVGSVADDTGFLGFRPSSIEVTVGATTTTLSDQLSSLSGRYLDALSLEVEVPAGETSLTIQLFSRDDDGEWNCAEIGNCPASMVWVAAGLSIEEGGGEGCTPGYWKQDQHFGSYPAPLTPETLFANVFENAFPGMTLVQVLAQGGGGLKALGRHTVAALLNASSAEVNYDLGAGDVIDMFNDAYPGDTDAYEDLKNVFEGYNEQLCPLDRAELEDLLSPKKMKRDRRVRH
jgi:hypothetical protein